MKYRPLGKSGISVSEIGFGAWAIGGAMDVHGMPVGWGRTDDAQSIAAMERSRDLGVNFFDTSDVYGNGHSEELIGKCPKLKDCFVATKVGNKITATSAVKDFSPGHIRSALEGSLKRLRRETIDLYQLHNPPPEIWKSDDVFGQLAQLKSEGKIRLAGVSITTMEEGIHLIEKRKADCLQVLFNILNQEPAKQLIPLAQKRGVGIVVRVPLASGLLTGKFSANTTFPKDDNRSNYLNPKRLQEALSCVQRVQALARDSGFTLTQLALAFILKSSPANVPIPGAKTAKQAEENISAAGLSLDDALFAKIKEEVGDYNFFLRYAVRV
ncbi:MAG TPA: aldo/keto reductase [Acidobacteriota bacterium]|nr:aldo/keto reductase [Acidobacteriota bacterium]